MMRSRAAVAIAPGKPLEVMEVYLTRPQRGEVLVEFKASGLCARDAYGLSGADPDAIFPAIFGHEGAGIVIEVGKDVTGLKPGDHVVSLSLPSHDDCPICFSQKVHPYGSTKGHVAAAPFSMLDGTPLYQNGSCSTFAHHSVLPQHALTKVDPKVPFDALCYLGGGVSAGLGAVLNTAKVEAGARAVVFGLGAIGLNVVQGLRLAGADMIIGVDLNDEKKAWGAHFGMTHFVNPSRVEGSLVQHIIALTKTPFDHIGGADYSFDCTGNVKVMRDALESTHSGWGVSVVVGDFPAGAEIQTRPFTLSKGRVWKGACLAGDCGHRDLSKIVEWYAQGKIEVDRLITHKMPLNEINAGFDLMRKGQSIRAVVEF